MEILSFNGFTPKISCCAESGQINIGFFLSDIYIHIYLYIISVSVVSLETDSYWRSHFGRCLHKK